jgi:hypothetical protein
MKNFPRQTRAKTEVAREAHQGRHELAVYFDGRLAAMAEHKFKSGRCGE